MRAVSRLFSTLALERARQVFLPVQPLPFAMTFGAASRLQVLVDVIDFLVFGASCVLLVVLVDIHCQALRDKFANTYVVTAAAQSRFGNPPLGLAVTIL